MDGFLFDGYDFMGLIFGGNGSGGINLMMIWYNEIDNVCGFKFIDFMVQVLKFLVIDGVQKVILDNEFKDGGDNFF